MRHLLNHCLWGTRLTSQKADDKFGAKLVEARKIAIYRVIKPGKKSGRGRKAAAVPELRIGYTVTRK